VAILRFLGESFSKANLYWQIIRHSLMASGSSTCSGAHVAIPDRGVCGDETELIDGQSRGGHARARSDGLSQTGWLSSTIDAEAFAVRQRVHRRQREHDRSRCATHERSLACERTFHDEHTEPTLAA